MKTTDEYGTWEVTEGNGCINKVMVTPTQKWLDENPVQPDGKTKAIEEINNATTISALKTAMLKYINAE